MSKYYREEDLEKALIGFICETGIDEKPYDYAVNVLDKLPTIEIVRCKDCKYISKSQWVTNLDGTEKRYKCECIGDYMLERNFCSFGERIDNE